VQKRETTREQSKGTKKVHSWVTKSPKEDSTAKRIIREQQLKGGRGARSPGLRGTWAALKKRKKNRYSYRNEALQYCLHYENCKGRKGVEVRVRTTSISWRMGEEEKLTPKCDLRAES